MNHERAGLHGSSANGDIRTASSHFLPRASPRYLGPAPTPGSNSGSVTSLSHCKRTELSLRLYCGGARCAAATLALTRHRLARTHNMAGTDDSVNSRTVKLSLNNVGASQIRVIEQDIDSTIADLKKRLALDFDDRPSPDRQKVICLTPGSCLLSYTNALCGLKPKFSDPGSFTGAACLQREGL